MAGISKRVSGAWQNTSYCIRGTATDTITTLPITIYGDGTNATVSIKGNTTQSGTPTPDNPIMPQGCGAVTGNMFDKNTSPVTIYPSTSTISNSSNAISVIIPVEPNTTYTFGKASGNRNRFCETENVPTQGATVLNYINADGNDIQTITTGSTTHYILWWVGYQQTYSDIAASIMLNIGSTALPYEPYGYKIPISSANTTTPIYLGEVETTRKIVKIDLSELSWGFSQSATYSVYYASLDRDLDESVLPICNKFHAVKVASYADMQNLDIRIAQASAQRIAIRYDECGGDVSALIQILEGAYLYAVLTAHETAIVNEPLMKIGNYADTLSNVSIPTTDGVNTLTVGTTVQPSEVTVNYKGWHPAIVHERTNDAWT